MGRSLFYCKNMLINEALEIIHKLYENNNDFPDSSSEDFIARLEKFNTAIDQWESKVREGVLWKELFTSAPVTAGGTGSDNAPADFLWPAGSIWIGGNEYSFVRPEKARQIINKYSAKKIFWITGGNGAYKINTYPAIGAGTIFDVDYYKKATKFSTGAESTEIEMSDPYFGIYWVLTSLYLDDENSTQADMNLNISNDKIKSMELSNESTPFYQDNALEDINEPGFGF